jgi:hypothetical protein
MTDHPALTPLALALATLASLIAQVMRERHTAPPPPPHAAPMQRRLEEIERKTEALTKIMQQTRTATEKKLTPRLTLKRAEGPTRPPHEAQ